MKIQYIPAEDKLILSFRSVRGIPNKITGPFEMWWDNKGNIRALAILNFSEELMKFKGYLNWTQLGGIWKGVKISDKDIKEMRKAVLKRIEDRWDRVEADNYGLDKA